ncbi:MAG: hypothetical protein ACE5KH_03965, partial [Candidatus Geothermarchaeales archaeon]
GDVDKAALGVDIVIEATGESWEAEVLKAPGLVAVDFWHQYCSWYCRGDPNLDIDQVMEVFRHG